jgi:DNA-binding transcriptional ArsR family regulator
MFLSTAVSRLPQIPEERLDELLGALSDRTRRAMVARLAGGPARVTDLAEPFDVSLPAISRHLKVLERAGLVTRTVRGRTHVCSLRADALTEVEAWLRHYRKFWEGTLASLAAHAEEAP